MMILRFITRVIARLKARGRRAALIAALALCLAVPALAAPQAVSLAGNEGVRYSESVLPWEGGLLISNFGSEGMGPREDEDKGYILYYKDGETRTVVPADGRLHMPTGMAVKDGGSSSVIALGMSWQSTT